MQLTDRHKALLTRLEQSPILEANNYARAHVPDLMELRAEGLVDHTTTQWVITNEGRRALVAVDGKPRLTVESWRGRRQGGPS